MPNQEPKNFVEFWDVYVFEHQNPLNRWLHFVGTSLAIVLLVWFIGNAMFVYLPLCLFAGYGFAWVGHFFIEKNKPASFRFPLWSFIADYVMIWKMLTGKMTDELERVLSQK